uniref:Hemocyanin-like protein n=1 Tax=Coptotermes formosanus TaxID=36987 RepID=A0A0A0QKL4_COPFO|nr:hemocyanin-like protein [Coptotermes formosanus]
MNTALVCATVVALFVCGAFSDHHIEKKMADKTLLMKQMNVLRLVHRLHQENIFKEQVDVGNTYDIEAQISSYKNPKVVKDFISYYKKGMVKRWEPFSVYYKEHLKQAICLFDLFYFANDYDTFYKTACWARDRVNPLMFWYSFTIAVLHREDTRDVIMPPPYEVYPYFFVDNEVIQKGYEYWMMNVRNTPQHTHIIPMNYTMKNMENMLWYFTEDMGLNTYHMYYRNLYPSWFNVTEYGHTFDRRGEMFLYVQHQVLARYCIERWANGMACVEPFVYNKALKTAYNPKLMYHSGQVMPPRPSGMMVTNFDTFTIDDIKNYERRVSDAIDFGYVKDERLKVHSIYEDKKGIEYLGQMMEGTYNSPHYYYYGSLFHLYRMMVGHMMDPLHKHGLAPSALEQPPTALRDPVYYQLSKRMYLLVKKYKERLPRYTHEELLLEGVTVENVEVGKLYTYMENFEVSLGSTICVAKEEDMNDVNMHVRMQRLNHKPFTYKIEVSSDKAVDAYVRVFLAPKHNHLGEEMDMNDRRHLFVEMDRFPYHVQVGKTVIERNSHDSSIVAPTPDSYRTFWKKVTDAVEGKTQYYIDRSHNYCGFPKNLLLPKGQKGGMAFTFYVIITPYVKQDEHDFEPYDYKSFSYCGVGHGRKYPDDKPLGFPFDRQIRSKDFNTPNMFFKDVYIFHKKLDEVSTTTH